MAHAYGSRAVKYARAPAVISRAVNVLRACAVKYARRCGEIGA